MASLASRNAELTMNALNTAIAKLSQLDDKDPDVWIAEEATTRDPSDAGSNIRTRLLEANKTVADLAARLGQPTHEVRERLAGTGRFADHEIATAAEFLGVDIQRLAPAGPTSYQARPVPVFPMPVREYSAEPAGDDEARLYGYCAWFCEADVPSRGSSVSDHGGPWCESLALATMNGIGIDGLDVELYAALAKGYHHGFYLRDELGAHPAHGDEQYIHFLLVDAHRHRAEWVANSGQARKLGAGLQHAADVLERIAASPRLDR